MPSSQAIFSLPHPDPVAPHTNVESSKPSSQNSDKADGSSDTSESRRARRARSQRKIQPLSPLQPVIQPSHVSTFEFPRQGPAVTASGSAESLHPLTSTLDDPALTPDSTALISASPSVDGYIRKKSGEPLKSSLKSRPPTPRPNLSVVTTRQVSSKSEPATPNHMRSKSVSFAERLDHVKLFFAEQKPIAVSRDGSPTEDTSGTESEVPAPVRTISSDDAKKRLLVMQVASMPQWTTMDVDVMLEDVALSKEATLCGHVKVKNLAFQKSVAVRFTFDCWQTTSEVSAKYEQSLAHGAFDRFSFVIRLHDILSKIEDKTLFMAIRYAVNGQEIWDNNGGQDYKIKFSLPVPLRAPGTIAQIQYASDEEAVANLTQRLERVQSTEALKNTHRRRRSGGTDEDFFFKSSASLSSRYTWGASLKEPWKPTELSSPSHSRPTTQPPSSSVFPWARKPTLSSQATQRARAVRSGDAIFTRGSPRLGDDNVTSGIVAHCHTPGDLPNDSVWRGALRNHTHVRQPSGLTDPGSPGGKMTRSVDDFISPRDKVGGNVDPGNPSVPVVEAPKFHVAGEIERISSDDSSSASSSSQPSPVVIAPGPPSNDMMSIINR
jgi:hypothetical protein